PWLAKLSFQPYNRLMGDSINNAAALKPDLIGAQVSHWPSDSDFTAYWAHPRPQDQELPMEVGVEVPVEVKNDWPDLCRQAATYARAIFAAVPLRSFSLVIGINHAKCELRFLIFHSGGLTSHSPLSFIREADRQIILRVMFAMSLWQTPEHAGLPCFTDGFSIVLASLRIGDPPIVIRTQEMLYHAVGVRGRNTVVYLLQLDTSAPAPTFQGKTLPGRTKLDGEHKLS
ncbi:hypothetical protein C8J57DRAFT_1053882, partial [Mycena rebaudengoi]